MKLDKKEKRLFTQVGLLLVALVGFLTMSSMLNSARGQTIGQTIEVYAYCLGQEHARKLTETVRVRGAAGYTSILKDTTVECYDVRIHTVHAKPMTVVLVEKVWKVTLPSGNTYQFWRIADESSDQGFVWVLVPTVKA